MIRPPTRWRAAVALAAAYALALHAFLIGFTPVQAGPEFGAAHVLCLPSGTAPDLPGAPAGHQHDGCCVLCAAHGLAPSAAPSGVGLPGYSSAALAPHVAERAPGPSERSPINPRAPPRAA